MGYGTEIDETQAVAWYLEATKFDYAESEYRLGVCYKEGKGIEKSYPLAASWLLKAAQKGNVHAKREGAICFEELNQPAAAAKLFLAAAEDGDVYSEEKIAEYFAEGYGCPKHEGLAIEYYTKACNHGSISAMLTLAYRYANGDGIKEDISLAIHWWMKASKESTEAQFALAECYIEGKGVTKDIAQGIKWLEKAAEENNTKAMLKLAEYAYKPISSKEPNPVLAKKWWTKAAVLGDFQAMYMLGKCYEEAIGVAVPNYKEAYKWYRLASQKGYDLASKECKRFTKGFFGGIKLKKKVR
jgi:TPR repeat protein